ncbi:ABC transporter permease subunit [Vibrio astriarenae]|uniref:ABC transporter permease subunit n=1 Tax=Vibrio astriarenae TaxID=1481923 RepID=A0A7Z2T1G7_9VIBR|nr:ABC transporter permease subunit [Vibrio astriarenae]QIA62616.1 ABC transporter permease subunit [Vibrio astriarenae]
MAKASISLRERDTKRAIKDRLFRAAVSIGGNGVLAALVLIFVYLAIVVLPLFSDAEIEVGHLKQEITTQSPVLAGIDDQGEQAYLLSENGQLEYWRLNQPSLEPSDVFSLYQQPKMVVAQTGAQGWFAAANSEGQLTLYRPQFASIYDDNQQSLAASVEHVMPVRDLQLAGSTIAAFSFGYSNQQLSLAGLLDDGRILLRWGSVDEMPYEQLLPAQYLQAEQILLTPDGLRLFVRTGSELVVIARQDDRYSVREVVDLSHGEDKHLATDMTFLAGAFSLLITHQDGLVSQWFEVIEDEQRQLALIRDFKLASELELLLPDTYRKGFFSFYRNGTLQSHYTTSEKLVLFERAYEQAPELVTMSSNEKFVLAYSKNKIDVALVNNPHPEISFSSLWQEVWYESYPEPAYVWQTTAGSDNFEPKFSLSPIVFGTLKAAVFAMLFAVPIAVLGAIYTAYFMSPQMRKVVKPSVELMEAFPTVIIGFLAGLWFAPIVETYLPAVISLLIFLPLSTILVGGLWHCLPRKVLDDMPNGWHALILMPAIIVIVTVLIWFSGEIEMWLFDGDVRRVLADYGISYDQRNALVVGFAMGFAVIPTIFTIAEDAIFSVPKHLSDGSLALGATPWQTLVYVVLLTASPGIFSAVMMGLGRAVGETMIVLMATGNTPVMDWNVFEGMKTLAATIAVEMPESDVASSHYRILFLAALLLLAFTFAVNSLAEWVRLRLREKYRAL